MTLDTQPVIDLIRDIISRYGSKAFVSLVGIFAIAWLVDLGKIDGDTGAVVIGSIVIVNSITRLIEYKSKGVSNETNNNSNLGGGVALGDGRVGSRD